MVTDYTTKANKQKALAWQQMMLEMRSKILVLRQMILAMRLVFVACKGVLSATFVADRNHRTKYQGAQVKNYSVNLMQMTFQTSCEIALYEIWIAVEKLPFPLFERSEQTHKKDSKGLMRDLTDFERDWMHYGRLRKRRPCPEYGYERRVKR